MSTTLDIIKRKFTNIITKFYDPLVDINIGNQVIKIPLSHHLRNCVNVYPDFNFNLPRIIKYSLNFVKDIKVIDIGANIGDTVAYIKSEADVPILCIDADEKYLKILKQNTLKYNNISICHALVGEETKTSNVELKTERGTGIVENSSSSTSIRTLQNILDEFPEFKNSKFLKIDTDGYDTLIIRGGANYLKIAKPILFFEFDTHLISSNDDPFSFMNFLISLGYKYFIFYVSTGEYLLSCNSSQQEVINELIHYFSGRKVVFYADICAFTEDDKQIFDYAVKEEIAHFRKQRKY